MMFKHAGTTLFQSEQIVVKSREYRIKFIKGIVVKWIPNANLMNLVEHDMY